MTKQISHAEASGRLAELRAQLASIEAELAAATQRRDDHECDAVLAGAEIDTSFRSAVDALQTKSAETSNLIRTLTARVEDIRKKEAEAALAEKRAAAEKRIRNLLVNQREKSAAVIAAVFACEKLFREAAGIRAEIMRTLAVEFPGEPRHVPWLPPDGPFRFLDPEPHSLDIWAQAACEYSYAEFVPADSPGKKRFLANKKPEAELTSS